MSRLFFQTGRQIMLEDERVVPETASESDFSDEPKAGRLFWAALLAVYGLLVLYSFLRVPIPGVNEPHYLCKAKHFWNPDWCAGDMFLESSNPHLVFYVTFGWLTRFLSLDTVAVVGRVVGLLPLAIGWHLLSWRLTRSVCVSLLSLSLFLVMQSAGNWSGEWLVGGIESKVIAYGFLFWSIAQALNLKLSSSALLAGLSISFHPVVGVWGTLAATIATLGLFFITDKSEARIAIPSPRTLGLAILLFFITSAPGLISAGQAVLSESDPDASRIASLLQVGVRLGHHLDPMKFPKEAYRYFGILIFVWLILSSSNAQQTRSKWWNMIVLASIFIAACGVAVGWGPRPLKEMANYEWRITALKFYPFRLADLLVPVAVSIAVAAHLFTRLSKRFNQKVAKAFVVLLVVCLATWGSLVIPGSDQNPSKMSHEKRNNWIATCRWIEENTPADTLVYSFDNQWAVKWFCQRAEYVNYKDCPQDAQSIIEWNQRRWVIARWKKNAFADGEASASELRELSRKSGASLFICDRLGPMQQEPDYQNKDFRVYLVRENQASAPPSGNR